MNNILVFLGRVISFCTITSDDIASANQSDIIAESSKFSSVLSIATLAKGPIE